MNKELRDIKTQIQAQITFMEDEALKEQLHARIERNADMSWEPIEERLNMFSWRFRCNSTKKLSNSFMSINGTVKAIITQCELVKGLFYLDHINIDTSVYLRFETTYSSQSSPFLNKELLFDLKNLLEKELPLGVTYRIDAELHKVNIYIK